MNMNPLLNAAIACTLTLLVGCGGGGGGSDSESNRSLSVSFAKDAYHFDYTAESRFARPTISADIKGGDGFNLLTVMVRQDRNEYFEPRLIQARIDEKLVIQLPPKATNWPGDLSGQLEISVCEDRACQTHVSGSPFKTSYTMAYKTDEFFLMPKDMTTIAAFSNNETTLLNEESQVLPTIAYRMYVPEKMQPISLTEAFITDWQVENFSQTGFDVTPPANRVPGNYVDEYPVVASDTSEMTSLVFNHTVYEDGKNPNAVQFPEKTKNIEFRKSIDPFNKTDVEFVAIIPEDLFGGVSLTSNCQDILTIYTASLFRGGEKTVKLSISDNKVSATEYNCLITFTQFGGTVIGTFNLNINVLPQYSVELPVSSGTLEFVLNKFDTQDIEYEFKAIIPEEIREDISARTGSGCPFATSASIGEQDQDGMHTVKVSFSTFLIDKSTYSCVIEIGTFSRKMKSFSLTINSLAPPQ